MNLLNKNYKPTNSENIRIKGDEFWYFDIESKDFFLKTTLDWFDLKTDAYVIEVSGKRISIPTNYYMIIGDYDGGLDSIAPFEIIGRQFDLFIYNTTLEANSWSFEPLKIVGYEKNVNFTLPNIKHLISISISDTKAIFVSEKDMYNKIKTLSFTDII